MKKSKGVVKMSNKEYFTYMDKWLEKKRTELQPPNAAAVRK